jgi:hypothetical protein
MTKQTNMRVKEWYLISQLEVFDLDLLVMSSIGSFLVYLGTSQACSTASATRGTLVRW